MRWTNIFDPTQAIYRGDLISGPMVENFGRGIVDIDLRQVRGQSKRFSHTRYWASDASPGQLAALRSALNFLDVDCPAHHELRSSRSFRNTVRWSGFSGRSGNDSRNFAMTVGLVRRKKVLISPSTSSVDT